MTTSDHESQEKDVRIDLRRLPTVLEVRARIVRYEKGRVYYEGPKKKRANEAVEIYVVTNEAIPSSAITPALEIGEARLSEFEHVGKHTYRFFGFDVKALKEGAEVCLCWPDSPDTKGVATGHVLRFLKGDEQRGDGKGKKKKKKGKGGGQ